jgi:hypothetical protein
VEILSAVVVVVAAAAVAAAAAVEAEAAEAEAARAAAPAATVEVEAVEVEAVEVEVVASRTVDPFSNSSILTGWTSNLEETQTFSTATQSTNDHRYSRQLRSST